MVVTPQFDSKTGPYLHESYRRMKDNAYENEQDSSDDDVRGIVAQAMATSHLAVTSRYDNHTGEPVKKCKTAILENT